MKYLHLSFLLIFVVPPEVVAQSWTPTLQKTYEYCLQKYGHIKGTLGCHCDVEKIARGYLPLEIAEACIEGKGDQGYKQQKPWEKAQAH